MILYSNDIVYTLINTQNKSYEELEIFNNEINNKLYEFTKEMANFYDRSTENINFEKIKVYLKAFAKKIIEALIAFIKMVNIKINELKGAMHTKLYKNFKSEKLVNMNLSIHATPLPEDFNERIETFINDIYTDTLFIDGITSENFSSNNIDNTLDNIFENFFKKSRIFNILFDIIEDVKVKLNVINPMTHWLRLLESVSISNFLRVVVYGQASYAGQAGTQKEIMTIGNYLKCGPRQKPKMIEFLSPEILKKCIDIRKITEKNLTIIKDIISEKNFKNDLEMAETKSDEGVAKTGKIKLIMHIINFMYNVNYFLFLEIIRIRSNIVKAIKLGCCGSIIKSINQFKHQEKDVLNQAINNTTMLKSKTGQWKIFDNQVSVIANERQIQIVGEIPNMYEYFEKNPEAEHFLAINKELNQLQGRCKMLTPEDKGNSDIEYNISKNLKELKKIIGVDEDIQVYFGYGAFGNLSDSAFFHSSRDKSIFLPSKRKNFDDYVAAADDRNKKLSGKEYPLHYKIQLTLFKEIEKINIQPGDCLYHTTEAKKETSNLKFLYSKQYNQGGFVFESPRLYCGYNFVLIRNGLEVKSILSKLLFSGSYLVYKVDLDLSNRTLFRDYGVFNSRGGSNSVALLCKNDEQIPVVDVTSEMMSL